MTEVKLNTHYTKEGQCFIIRFQCTSMDDAIELAMNKKQISIFNGLYGEDYRHDA